ncbi:uncharacterized protein JCM6883_003582 [Sporobolomyces salmoneus]|uniref:uncharacterized protein n=1 Tax=Sporobolomyces salmoneus TaxID=183962 RepID=UPI00316FD173
MLHPSLAILTLFATTQSVVYAAPTTGSTTLNDRSTFQVLADGSSYQSGDITANLRWQASGLLSIGCSEVIGIENCYTMSLSANGDLEKKARARRRSVSSLESISWESLAVHDDSDLEAYTSPWNALEEMYWQNSLLSSVTTTTTRGGVLDARVSSNLRKRQDVKKCDSGGGGGPGDDDDEGGNEGPPKPPAPRQRIEMFSWPGARSGETWSFSWKSHQGATSITSKFFHTWQILRRDCGGGPIITLDLKGGKAVVSDNMRGCVDCSSVDASVFIERTIQHQLQITFGLNGSINYRAYDVTPSSNFSPTPDGRFGGVNLTQRPPVLTYEAYGDMGDQASLKFGQYRAVTEGLEDVTTYVGDYQAIRLN